MDKKYKYLTTIKTLINNLAAHGQISSEAAIKYSHELNGVYDMAEEYANGMTAAKEKVATINQIMYHYHRGVESREELNNLIQEELEALGKRLSELSLEEDTNEEEEK